mgnify:CR=1 FL=1
MYYAVTLCPPIGKFRCKQLMKIFNTEGASAVFMGITETINGVVRSAADWAKGSINWGLQQANKLFGALRSGLNFFKQWFVDDPVGASAGAAAVILTGAVVIGGAGAVTAVGGSVLAGLTKLAGIVGAAGGVLRASLTVKGIFGAIVAGTAIWSIKKHFIVGAIQLYNFDWNVTDKAYADMQKQLFNSLAGQLGETLGHSIAALVCSSNPSFSGVDVDTELLAKSLYILHDGNTNDAAKDGIIDAFGDLLYFTRYVGSRLLMINSYVNARKWVRNNVRTGIAGIDKAIKAWGTTNKSWRLAEKVEEAIESIDNQTLQNFTEELVEEFIDACYDYAVG